jgi:hypothetical protein
MTTKVKVIFNKSTKSGFNQNDSAMLSEKDAADVVKSGDAHYESPPIKKTKSHKGHKSA